MALIMDKTKNYIFILILYTLSNITIESKYISTNETSALLKAFNKPDRNDSSVYFLPVNEVNIVRELQLVPWNVTKLCFIMENTHALKRNEYDITGLQHLQNLEELWITSKDSSKEGIYRNHYGVYLKFREIYSSVFTSKLKRLHINVILGKWWLLVYKYSFSQLRNVFGQLDVLDLSGINLFGKVEDVHRVTGYSNNITALSLSGVMNEHSAAVIFNLTAFFGHYFHSSLQYVDVSHNYIGAVYGSMIDSLPNLKVLDLSHNLLLHIWPHNSLIYFLSGDTKINYLQLFSFHPKIEIIIGDEQKSSAECGRYAHNTRRKRHVQYDVQYEKAHNTKRKRQIRNICYQYENDNTRRKRHVQYDVQYENTQNHDNTSRKRHIQYDVQYEKAHNTRRKRHVQYDVQYEKAHNTRRKRHVQHDGHMLNIIYKVQYENLNVETCFEIYNISSVNELASDDKITNCEVFNCFYALLNELPLTYSALPWNFVPTFNELKNMLDFTGNCFGNLQVPFSPNLEELHMNHLNIIYNKATDKKRNICFSRNSLEVLSLRQSSGYLLSSFLPDVIAGDITFTGLDALKIIDFSQNRLDIYLNVSLFTRLKVLTNLNISGNFLKFPENEITKGYENLSVLDISSNQISVIPFQSLANLFKLRQLYVKNNRLETFHMNITNLNFLQYIDLSDNKIRTFSADTMVGLKAVRKERLNIDLQTNELSCTCDEHALATVELILSADYYNLKFTEVHSYFCTEGNTGYKLLSNIDIGKLKRDCKYPNLNIILGVTISNAILIMLITSILLIYKFRYRILTLCYRLKWKFMYSGKHNIEFHYDVFVSYSSKDIIWMHDMLMLTLENMYGFRLCVDYRDFLAGSAIVDAIIDNINKSKIVIVILSENSLNSGYCEFELKIAHDHLLRLNKKLIIIKLGDVDTTNAAPLVKHLLENRLYIEWPAVVSVEGRQYSEHSGGGDKMEDKIKLFWAKLRNALYHHDPATDMPKVRQSYGKSRFYSCDCFSAESGSEDSQPIVLYENTQID